MTKNKMKKTWGLGLLFGIVVLAAVLRFAWLGQHPAGVTPDEIQQGYSAYSVLKTGKDEWGDLLPIFPRSFGDYRPPLYVYLTVPAVALFDLNMFAVRLPSAVFGVLGVMVMYLLTLELFKQRAVALLAALILAISSWHFFYSRAAWESNATIVFFMLGLWMFLKADSGKRLAIRSWWMVGSAISFGLTMFGYYSFQMFTPLFVAGLIALRSWQGDFKQHLKDRKKWLFVAVFGLFVLTLIYGQLFTGAGRRAGDAALYNPENLAALRDVQVDNPLPQPWGRVINNKIAYLGSQFSQNYLGYFSTTFLASPDRSDSSLYNLPGQWLLSVWEIIFVLVGLFMLFKTKVQNGSILMLWMLIAPIPAALTRNYMHTQRVEVLLLIFPILAAFGIWSAITNIKKIPLRYGLIGLVGLFMFGSLVKRVDFYAFRQFDRPLGGVHYNYQEIFAYTEANKDKYDQILFTKSQGQPQIYLAFYSKMDPVYFQSQSQNWKDFEKEFKFLDQTEYKLGKYEFKNIGWNDDKVKKNALIVGSEQETPDGVKASLEIRDPFKKIMFRVFDTNNEL
jgi:4-amino-4-deoxy-L-arabinose transferase-like glycosyltransferase